MSFHVGQKVVCVSDNVDPGEPGPYVVKGRVYTVARVYVAWNDSINIELQELNAPEEDGWDAGYIAANFRPVKEINLDIFTAMLAPTPKVRVTAQDVQPTTASD